MFLDPIALHKWEELVKKYQFKMVIETGTQHADSTLIFSHYVETVVSVEVDALLYHEACNNVQSKGYQIFHSTLDRCFMIKGNKHILLFRGNSGDFLPSMTPYLQKPVCFFLDAHDRVYWPIKDELKAIRDVTENVIIIHDIKVEGKDFGFDHWCGVRLNKDAEPIDVDFSYYTIKEDLNPDYKISFNEEAAGCYRGILYAEPPEK